MYDSFRQTLITPTRLDILGAPHEPARIVALNVKPAVAADHHPFIRASDDLALTPLANIAFQRLEFLAPLFLELLDILAEILTLSRDFSEVTLRLAGPFPVFRTLAPRAFGALSALAFPALAHALAQAALFGAFAFFGGGGRFLGLGGRFVPGYSPPRAVHHAWLATLGVLRGGCVRNFRRGVRRTFPVVADALLLAPLAQTLTRILPLGSFGLAGFGFAHLGGPFALGLGLPDGFAGLFGWRNFLGSDPFGWRFLHCLIVATFLAAFFPVTGALAHAFAQTAAFALLRFGFRFGGSSCLRFGRRLCLSFGFDVGFNFGFGLGFNFGFGLNLVFWIRFGVRLYLDLDLRILGGRSFVLALGVVGLGLLVRAMFTDTLLGGGGLRHDKRSRRRQGARRHRTLRHGAG
jgi:hypothetical protein